MLQIIVGGGGPAKNCLYIESKTSKYVLCKEGYFMILKFLSLIITIDIEGRLEFPYYNWIVVMINSVNGTYFEVNLFHGRQFAFLLVTYILGSLEME